MTVTSFPAVRVLAGSELSPGEAATILAVVAVVAVLLVVFVTAFVAALVKSAQYLHRAGRLRHPVIAVAIPICAPSIAVLNRFTPAATLLALAALGFGYLIMWRSGRGWFRWTVFAALPWVSALLVIR